MIAAIYARKSTEQTVADEAKSVTRQIAHAREYATRKGWTVDEASVYVDDGISGAEFAKRPGFVRLMAALKPRPPFNVLVMSEESRLGREAIETSYALKQLVTAGVRVFFYLEDHERTLDSPTDKILLSLTAYADELEREKARQRVTDAMTRKARAGYVTGGRVFGYDNLEVRGPSGERSHVLRQVNDAEASIVRRIFELAAAGAGQARIAKQLNVDRVVSPRPQQGRPAGWATSSVHEVLFRELYRGEIIWNRTRKRNRWGEKCVADRPPAEWLRVPAPALRIVSEDLWTRAHQRIALSRAQYDTATKGTRAGRPTRDVESKYLLPGFARCGCCNGGLHVRTASGSRKGPRVFFYACTSHFNRGADVCANALRVRMHDVDEAVLDRIRTILTPDLVDDVVARLRELVDGGDRRDHRERMSGKQQLETLDVEISRLTDSIAMGRSSLPSLVRRLQDAETRRQDLVRALDGAVEHRPAPRIDWGATEREARQRLQEWRALLTRQVTKGRELFRQLLVAPIQFTPFEERGRRGYRFAGEAAVTGLFDGVVDVQLLQRSWRPQRDSNPRSLP